MRSAVEKTTDIRHSRIIFAIYFSVFGPESAWILIDFALLNPDPYRECGSGSRKFTKLPKKPDFQPFKMAFVPT
jgi:hypothetical protein